MIADHESEKAGRVMEALLQMKKIDIAALGRAAAGSTTAGAHSGRTSSFASRPGGRRIIMMRASERRAAPPKLLCISMTVLRLSATPRTQVRALLPACLEIERDSPLHRSKPERDPHRFQCTWRAWPAFNSATTCHVTSVTGLSSASSVVVATRRTQERRAGHTIAGDTSTRGAT